MVLLEALKIFAFLLKHIFCLNRYSFHCNMVDKAKEELHDKRPPEPII